MIILAVDKDKNVQVLVTFPNGMLEQIETYWHDNKLKNRNEAIRELVETSLKNAKTPQ